MMNGSELAFPLLTKFVLYVKLFLSQIHLLTRIYTLYLVSSQLSDQYNTMKKHILLSISAGLVLLSCNKVPGEGGTSSISGKVYIYDLNVTGLDTIDQYYAMDEDVYIIYGDEDSTYDDKFATSLDGSFRFDNLTEGTYTIYAYSRCDVCPDDTEAKQVSVEISGKKQDIKLDDIIILK